MRNTDRGTPVGDTVAESVDGLGFVQAGETLLVLRAVGCDVFFHVLFELVHELLEVFLAARLTEDFGGEVAVHAGSVPVALEGLAVPVDVDAVFLADAEEQVAGDPDLVGGGAGALAEDLEFPLALGDLGVDALVIDACVQAGVDVLLDDGTGDVTDVLVADAGVVFTLWLGEAVLGPTEGTSFLDEEVFLFEAEPGVGVIDHGGAGVRGVRLAVGEHNLTHDEEAVPARVVGIECDRLEHAVGVAAFGLLGRGAVEAPHRAVLEGAKVSGLPSTILVLPRRFGIGSYPSSQRYSSFSLAIGFDSGCRLFVLLLVCGMFWPARCLMKRQSLYCNASSMPSRDRNKLLFRF